MNILVFDTIGKAAISRDSGLKIKTLIDKQLSDTGSVVIDFSNVELYASPFFNAAIATYLGTMTVEQMREQFSFLNLNNVGRNLLNQVIHNAIQFYSKSEEEQEKIQSGIENGVE